jgi:hypothetical protein
VATVRRAGSSWPVLAFALGGAGGELLGGLWVLLVSGAARPCVAEGPRLARRRIGVVGLISVVPPLHDATIAFELLQIVWSCGSVWFRWGPSRGRSTVQR